MGKAIDITGQKFGELTAVEQTEQRKAGCIVWHCKCSCGADVYTTAKDLRSGNTKSCGHLRTQITDLTGQKFGRLTVVSNTGKRYQNNVIWHCKCDCGNEVDVIGRSLTGGNTKSCGCLNFAPRPTPPDVVAGTKVSMLNKTIPANNTSGVRGVSWSKQHGDWEAYIKFKGNQFHLGHYDDLSEAEKVRKQAEKALHENFLDFYTELTLYTREPGQTGRPPKNIRGEKFGKLTALYPTKIRKNTSVVWVCQCDCGELINVKLNHLTSGHTTSCTKCGSERMVAAVRKYDRPRRPKSIETGKDLSGHRFGFLRVVKPSEKRLNALVVWICRCDCGKQILVDTATLKRGARLRSCGCTHLKKGVYHRKCTICGHNYPVRPGEVGTVCDKCREKGRYRRRPSKQTTPEEP